MDLADILQRLSTKVNPSTFPYFVLTGCIMLFFLYPLIEAHVRRAKERGSKEVEEKERSEINVTENPAFDERSVEESLEDKLTYVCP